MSDSTSTDEQAWHWLWSAAARQIIVELASSGRYEVFSAGYGWGLREPEGTRRALLLHPSGEGRAVGDLSLNRPGVGSEPIARGGRSYIEYLAVVRVAVAEALERLGHE